MRRKADRVLDRQDGEPILALRTDDRAKLEAVSNPTPKTRVSSRTTCSYEECFVMQNRLFDLAGPLALFDGFAQVRPRTIWATDSQAVRETEHGYEFSIDLPGVDPNTVEVAAEGTVLFVRAERKPRFEGKEAGIKSGRERYSRQFDLQRPIDTAGVTASLDQGVLSIVVNKADAAKRVKIPVRVTPGQAS